MSDELEQQAAALALEVVDAWNVQQISDDILAVLRRVRQDALNDAGLAQMFTVLDPDQHMRPVGTATLKKVTRDA